MSRALKQGRLRWKRQLVAASNVLRALYPDATGRSFALPNVELSPTKRKSHPFLELMKLIRAGDPDILWTINRATTFSEYEKIMSRINHAKNAGQIPDTA